jgi:hypothetical protein
MFKVTSWNDLGYLDFFESQTIREALRNKRMLDMWVRWNVRAYFNRHQQRPMCLSSNDAYKLYNAYYKA